MAGSADPELFKPALIILGSAGLVIPIVHRLKISPLIGFIVIGIAVGPSGLGLLAHLIPPLGWITITDVDAIAPIGEMGVVMLMFMIGLELSWPRLKLMRRLVFGLGALQVLVCAAAIAGICLALGLHGGESVIIGLALAMSPTAVVVQLLADGDRLGAPVGRAALAVLLFQDLAAVPILFVLGIVGTGPDQPEGGLLGLGLAVGQAALAIGALLLFGRLGLRRLLRRAARTGSPELFMAACLLVVLATGLAAQSAGLSMAMGALIAGLLLAETEYRRQIEVTIEPFKGLLLGVFLIWVGMGLDVRRIIADPAPVIGLALCLVALKFALIYALNRIFGLKKMTSLHAALLLAPGGEFGFVILGAALVGHLVPPADDGYALILAAVTMAAIPPLDQLARHAAALYALGATDAVPETIEASLQLSESVLVDLGIPMGPVIASIHEKRSEFQAQIKGMAPDATVRTRGRRRLRDARPA